VIKANTVRAAALHTLFVGFLISLIFGHAPIVFPAILGAPITHVSAFLMS
jgi:hypothetical protein